MPPILPVPPPDAPRPNDTRSPFSPRDKVRRTAWKVPVDTAVEDAVAAGFSVTSRSGPNRVNVQRDWMTAATITPIPGGVVVKPAWTTAQLAIVAGVLVVLFLGVCGLPVVGGPA